MKKQHRTTKEEGKMTHKEAVNWLINLAADIGKAEHQDLWHYEQALTEIREILETEGGWIPCSERMPDEDCLTGANVQYSVPVLMTDYNAEDEETIVDYGHTVDGRWYSDTTDLFVPSLWEVLAWMPLPEPWKGKE